MVWQRPEESSSPALVSAPLENLEAAAQYAANTNDEASRDEAVNFALGACGRELGRGDPQIALPAARIAARVSRLASGRHRLPMLSGVADAVVGWALDPHFPRRPSLEVVHSLAEFGENAWYAEIDMTTSLVANLDADLRALADTATDDVSAGCAADLARCLAAIARNAPYAVARLSRNESVASRCITSLVSARRVVSNVDAWDDLTIEISSSITRGLSIQDCWPAPYCLVSKCLLGSGLLAIKGAVGGGGDRQAKLSRLRRRIETYQEWQHVWISPQNSSTPYLENVKSEARQCILFSSLTFQNGDKGDAFDEVSALGRVISLLYQELVGAANEIARNKSRQGGVGVAGGLDDEDGGEEKPFKTSRSSSSSRSAGASGRKPQRAKPQRLSAADEETIAAAIHALNSCLGELVPGNQDAIATWARNSSEFDDAQKYSWIVDVATFGSLANFTKLSGDGDDNCANKSDDKDALKMLLCLTPLPTGPRCWSVWLGKVASAAAESKQGDIHRALILTLTVAMDATNDDGSLLATVSALLDAGGSLRDADESQAASCFDNLAKMTMRSLRAEWCTIAASCLVRLVDASITIAIADSVCDAILEVARTLGGGRELLVTRGNMHETARLIESSARALILVAARLGRAVPRRRLGADTIAAAFMFGASGRSLPLGSSRSRRMASADSSLNSRTSTKSSGEKKDEPWPLDSPIWTETVSPLYARNPDSPSYEDAATALFECFLSREAREKLALAGSSSPPAAATDPATEETVTKSRLTSAARELAPPVSISASVDTRATSEVSMPSVQQTPTVVLPMGASTTRGGAISRKPGDPGKRMLMLRRGPTTESDQNLTQQTSAPSSQDKAVVHMSKPVATATTKGKRQRELFSRVAPAEVFARAIARYAVGAKLKTRLGGAASTLGTLRSEINHTSTSSAALVALVVALEQEITAASELPPRSHANHPDNADRVRAFGTIALKPSLAVAAFFRQNRAVCDEWLRSIRLPAAELAVKHRLFADAAYHAEAACFSANDTSDYPRSLAVGTLAYVALGDEYAIRASLEEASTDSAGDASSFWWLQAAADVACGRYEIALSTLLERGIAAEPAIVELCVELIARCLAVVGDVDAEADFATKLTARRREAYDDQALLAALSPRRSVLALERWACPPDDGGEFQPRKRSIVGNFDFPAALDDDRKFDDDLEDYVVLMKSAVSDEAALFDASRKFRSSPALFDDLSRIFDVGRLSALADRSDSLIDGTLDPAHRTDLYAAAAIAAREAKCTKMATRFVDAALFSSEACPDAPRRLGAPVFAALERIRLLPEPTAESFGTALSAAETAFFSTTIHEFAGDATRSPLFKSTAQWLAETLEEVLPMVSSSEFLSGMVRRIVQKVESGDVSCVEGNPVEMCLATAAALTPLSAKRWISLGEWHEARHDSSSAKRAFARALAIGSGVSARLCASRALRLITANGEDDTEDAQWEETPVAVWEGVAPQLLAECYRPSRRQDDGNVIRESLTFKLLRRVALAAPRIVVHAIVVGIREGRRSQSQLSTSDQEEAVSGQHQSALDGVAVSLEENAVRAASNRLADESDDDEFDGEDEHDDEDAAEEDDEASPQAKKVVVLSQRKRAATGFLGGDSNEWIRGAIYMRALRAEMALFGMETRKLLRATELLVDELKCMARLPEDRWRLILQSSTLARIGDLSHVRALAGYYDLAGPDAAEVPDPTAADVAAREIAAFRSRVIAAPARHHLERVARDLWPSLEESSSGSSIRPYDRNFAARVRPLIENVVEELKNVAELSRRKKRGGTFERKVDDAWHVVTESLRHLRNTVTVSEWIGSEISPALSSLTEDAEDMCIPVVRSSSKESSSFCRVVKINDRVSALSSKTRPKKVSFTCEDTNRSFLLKGAEDVHLDQRIMQLLDVVNDVLRREATRGRPPPLIATYAVLPLSRNSGLIEWVPRTRTLFSLYNDEMTSKLVTSAIDERHQQSKKGGGGDNFGLDPALVAAEPEKYAIRYDALPRAFYSEIEKHDNSLSRKPRSSWPHQALRVAYDNLAADAPTRFVERELWRGSRDAADWLKRRRNYSAKLGASCVSAFSLGLGDRHLENVLYDDHDGSIVDVDWGICFDAGSLLRVPECVPFRLTPAIVAPLQRGGLRDGDFVRSARSLLSALRDDKPGGAAFLSLLELCSSDIRVEWRATLGGLAARQRYEDKSRRRAASHVAATTSSKVISALDEKNAATLALAAARCLGSSMLTTSVERRGACLRDIISKLNAFADAPLSTQIPTSENERDMTLLVSAVEQKKAELRIFAARKEAADNARTSVQAKISFELDRATRRREEQQSMLRNLLIGSATDSYIAELRSRAEALTRQTTLFDITALRDGARILSQGARLAHYAVREYRRLTFEQKRQRRQLNTEHEINGNPGGNSPSSRPEQGSYFSTEMFGVQRGGGVSQLSPWGGRSESTAERLRRKQTKYKGTEVLTPLGVVESEETRLVGSLADEVDADGENILDLRLPRAMSDLADAVEKFAPFIVVDAFGISPDKKVSEEEVYRVERAAAIATCRRRRVVETLEKFIECRPRAAATLSVCRGHARRSVRDGVPSTACVDKIVEDLFCSARLDGDAGSNETQHDQTSAMVRARKLLSRLLFLEQERRNDSNVQQSSSGLNAQKGGAIGDALRCMAFASDADVADTVGCLSQSSAGVVFQTVSRLEAIREAAIGLGVVVEVVYSSQHFPRVNDASAAANGLKHGLISISQCADAASKMARDASRLVASSLFDKPTDAASTEWRRRMIELYRSKTGQMSWIDLTTSSESPTDLTVLRALEKLMRPIHEHLIGAVDALRPVVNSDNMTTDLSKSFAEAKLAAALAVLGARHDALLAISHSGCRFEVLRHGDQAEGECAYAVCSALRSACGQPIEVLLEGAIARIRSLVVQHRHSGGTVYTSSYATSSSVNNDEIGITLNCLRLVAAAQMSAMLDRADGRDAVTRLRHHFSRRERRAIDTASARACGVLETFDEIEIETREEDLEALCADISFEDEDLILAMGSREDDDNDGQLATIEADRRAKFKRIGLLRARIASRNRSLFAARLAEVSETLEDIFDAVQNAFDRRVARRAVVASILARVGASQPAAVGGDNYVVWLRKSDAHFFASNLLGHWLSEARLLARVAIQSQSNSADVEEDMLLGDAYDRANAEVVAAKALHESGVEGHKRAEEALVESRENRLRAARARDALREFPAIFKEFLYSNDRPYRATRRKGKRKGQQHQSEVKSSLPNTAFEDVQEKIAKTFGGWAELAERCREFASLAMSRPSAGNTPPGIVSPSPLERRHKDIDIRVEATRLARRFEDIDRLDQSIRELIKESEALQSLSRAPDSERFLPAGTKNRFLDDAAKFSRKARKMDYCISFHQQPVAEAGSPPTSHPPFALKTLQGVLEDESYTRRLVLRVLGIARTSCRAASAVLDIVDIENVPRFDDVNDFENEDDTYRDDGDKEVSSTYIEPVSDDAVAKPYSRLDAAKRAFGAVAKRLDGTQVSSVEQQLASLIHTATDPDILCQMYEGWAPWI